MSEQAPNAGQDYKNDQPDAVIDDGITKAHAMALESNKTRSEAARTRGIGKLILSEIQKGDTDAFGRNAGERFALRTKDAEEHLYPKNTMVLSDDMQRAALEEAGLSGPMAAQQQLQRFYDARYAIGNNGGDAEKAVNQIEDYSKHLDNEAEKIEDAAAADYDSNNSKS